MRVFTIVSATLLALALAACDLHAGPVDVVQGSGHVTSVSRDVHGFQAVKLSGVGTLAISQGSTEALAVEAEDNLQPLLHAEVQGSTLRLGPRSVGLTPTRPIRYDLTVRRLDRIDVSGAASVQSQKLDAGPLTLSVSGASQVNLARLAVSSLTVQVTGTGDVTLTGQAPEQTVSISGAAKYRADGLSSQRVSVTVSGAGDCAVNASEHLSATITGAGRVRYSGSPTVQQSITGAGSITRSGP
jgi:hypothetical protein